MTELPLSSFRDRWVFNHQSMPVPEADQQRIHLLDKASAYSLWQSLVSKNNGQLDSLTSNDWPSQKKHWSLKGEWMPAWESDQAQWPDQLVLPWKDQDRVFYCLSQSVILVCDFDCFCRYWKNFLFLSETGSLLLSQQHQEAVLFLEEGEFKLGKRP